MYSEDQLLPISGLQHLAFCPRQCALIHLERLWCDTSLTALGEILHERVHNAASELRGNVLTVRGLPLRSLKLGLAGFADAVEFYRLDSNVDMKSNNAIESTPKYVALAHRRGLWRPYPVEYKRGRSKKGNCDTVQLCAQAICLEEMLNCSIDEGSLFYGEPRRRTFVRFDNDLRLKTERLAEKFHQLISSQITPKAEFKPYCLSCSLIDQCLPKLHKPAKSYFERHLTEET